ncbi:Uncharacterised protein [Metamycoplasma cloacale]|uniref:Restriction endonuclease n=1 Tax=Metamycoplasma cloacale TaxID=92401 RepID=A0A2Z4LM97_9BACT|nr:hypothetical protein [Metamycoplasma cloacale]AWX42869.1 restriction endonuclease [Metamycoplasma cloacale]VEU79309.1 Uncharacterised protein [Metamycoplasma cloacale]
MKKKYILEDYDSVLTELIENVWKNEIIKFSKINEDGRINSTINEEEAINILLSKYQDIKIFKDWELIIERQPKPRYWYDILIHNRDNTFYCPINIKISNLNRNTADNLNSKEGLYFSLTGKIEEKTPNTWGKYFELLAKNFTEHDSDYFFIIINKNNTSDIFYNSLRRIPHLTSNGNNPPFQCVWSKNRNIEIRTYEESKNYLMSVLYATVLKRAQILKEFRMIFTKHTNIKKKL